VTSSSTGSSTASGQSNGQAIQGCLAGSGSNLSSNLTLTANGKSYTLQGNTSQLSSLTGHMVEVVGDISSGTSINVQTVRDISDKCSAK
jgi:hypothetical protein